MSGEYVTVGIVVTKTLILVLGGWISYLTYRAHRRTGDRSLWMLALGFGIVTLGTLLAGVVQQILGFSIAQALLINSVLVAVGFAFIAYSLVMDH
jgi:hypothetical protein